MGLVRGRVENMEGIPLAGRKVIGFPPANVVGGLVYAVSDKDGNFLLRYHGSDELAYVEVDGGERQNHVANGQSIVLVVP